MLAEASVLASSSVELWHRRRLGDVLAEADRMAEDFALVVAMAAAELGDHERAMASTESVVGNQGVHAGHRFHPLTEQL
ncbi:hypothetical protein [Nocardia sp. NPDC004750]